MVEGDFERVRAEAQRRLGAGQTREDVIRYCRTQDCSKIDTIRVLTSILPLSLQEAKKVVHESPSWSDRKEIDEQFHQRLSDAWNAFPIHERWMEKRNRRNESAEYQDEWWREQCLRCAHWIPLTGPLGEDYGACANPLSPFDKTVMFEHDGCDAFEARPEP